MYPKYTLSERIADGCVHFIGIAFGLIGVVWLLLTSFFTLPFFSTLSLVIYSTGLLLMFGFSAAYHLIAIPSWKCLLRRFDQAAIFIKIAGTYTPFTLIKMGGFYGYGLFSTVWVIAFIGVIAKLYITSGWEKTFILLYLLLGWIGLVVLQPLIASVPALTLALLILGGVFYSVGIIFHLWETLFFQNVIWHIFVLAGTICHFGAVVTAIFE
ncbi:MAG: hemolysin III family protein [Pseudomonadota bacterium]